MEKGIVNYDIKNGRYEIRYPISKYITRCVVLEYRINIHNSSVNFYDKFEGRLMSFRVINRNERLYAALYIPEEIFESFYDEAV
jgi:hypothetical protein